jgi:hypothetical protein
MVSKLPTRVEVFVTVVDTVNGTVAWLGHCRVSMVEPILMPMIRIAKASAVRWGFPFFCSYCPDRRGSERR